MNRPTKEQLKKLTFDELAQLNKECLNRALEELKVNGVKFIKELSSSIDTPPKNH